MTQVLCSEDGCDALRYGRGLCKRHYTRAWSNGTLENYARDLVASGATLEERLRHHGWTVTATGCWEWKASLNTHGYGQLAVGTDRPMIASRAAYEAWVGPIPDGGVICHRCDNPPCINPDHLFLGDRNTNIRDMVDKKRNANGERREHKLTDAQVAEVRDLYATGRFSQRALADRYGVCQQFVSSLVRLERRRELTNPPLEHQARGLARRALKVGQ